MIPTDWVATKAYLQFFAGVICVCIAISAETLAGGVGSLGVAYLFFKAAFE